MKWQEHQYEENYNLRAIIEDFAAKAKASENDYDYLVLAEVAGIVNIVLGVQKAEPSDVAKKHNIPLQHHRYKHRHGRRRIPIGRPAYQRQHHTRTGNQPGHSPRNDARPDGSLRQLRHPRAATGDRHIATGPDCRTGKTRGITHTILPAFLENFSRRPDKR